jgi:hypothetical protein
MHRNLPSTSQDSANNWHLKKFSLGHESRWSTIVITEVSGYQRIKIRQVVHRNHNPARLLQVLSAAPVASGDSE